MLKVAIVEDELFMREFIENCIDYNEIGLTISGSFCCAEDALESFEKEMPDLVVTDIKMEGMDGITFMSEALKLNQNTHFIVVSNYQDFDIVRSAFKIGICDYISKISFEIDSYKNTLLNFVKMRQEQDKKKLVSKHLELKERFWNEVKADDNKEPVLFAVMDIINYDQIARLNWGMNKEKLKISILSLLEELLQDSGECMFFLNENDELFFFFKNSGFDKAMQVLKSIGTEFEKAFGFIVCICFNGHEVAVRNLQEEYNELCKLKAFRFLLPKDSIINKASVKEFTDKFEYIPAISKMETLLRNGEFKKASAELERIKNIKPSRECVHELLFFYQNMYLIICDYSKALEFDFQDEESIKELLDYSNYEDVCEKLRYGIQRISENLCVSEKDLSNKIDEYIMNNLSSQIEMKEMAEYFRYEYTYFSRLFSKIKGTTFKKYINNIRLEKAMDLIQTTNLTFNEISYEVGYHNYEHFARSFRSKYGCWPSEVKPDGKYK